MRQKQGNGELKPRERKTRKRSETTMKGKKSLHTKGKYKHNDGGKKTAKGKPANNQEKQREWDQQRKKQSDTQTTTHLNCLDECISPQPISRR
jgi:hypothetical protein